VLISAGSFHISYSHIHIDGSERDSVNFYSTKFGVLVIAGFPESALSTSERKRNNEGCDFLLSVTESQSQFK
jgi:hypothetical protein